MNTVQTASGTSTEIFAIVFRPVDTDGDWKIVADAPEFDSEGDAWNWTYDNPLHEIFVSGVMRIMTHKTLMARPLEA